MLDTISAMLRNSIFAGLLLSFFLPPLAAQRAGDAGDCALQEIILRIAPDTDPLAFTRAEAGRSAEYRLEYLRPLSERFGFHLYRWAGQAECDEVERWLSGQPGIIDVAWNTELQFRNTTPNDNFYPLQWGLRKIQLEQVWPVSMGGLTTAGDEIVLAVLDKGFDINHEDLAPTRWVNPGEIPGDGFDNDGNGYPDDLYGWNFRLGSSVYQVEVHGTEVAGVMGAATDNSVGIASPNWQARILYLGVFNVADVIQALQYLLDLRERYNTSGGTQGALVVAANASFGFDEVFCDVDPLWSPLYDPMGQAGILNVAAVSNEKWNVEEKGDMPGTCTSPYLIVTTASTPSDLHGSFGAWGPVSVDLAAPGDSIVSAIPNDQYAFQIRGTSLASPLVAATIGLLYSMPCTDLSELIRSNPEAAALLVRDAILHGTAPLEAFRNKTATGGRLDALGALKYLHSWCIAKPEERQNETFEGLFFGEDAIVALYPNPVRSVLKVKLRVPGFGSYRLAIHNALGQLVDPIRDVEVRPFEEQIVEMDVASLVPGTYYLSIVGSEKKATMAFIRL